MLNQDPVKSEVFLNKLLDLEEKSRFVQY